MFPFSSGPIRLRPRRRSSPALGGILAGLSICALSVALPVASAQAAGVPKCETEALSQPFLQWGDSNYYSLVAGGDVEAVCGYCSTRFVYDAALGAHCAPAECELTETA